jgi:hypothetical protein
MRRLVLIFAVSGVFGGSAPPLVAAAPPPAISQYVETIPTSGGSAVVGTGGRSTKKLPAAITKKIEKQAGNGASALELIATASDYGAPQQSLTAISEQLAKPKQRAGTTKATAAASKPRVSPSATRLNAQAMLSRGDDTQSLGGMFVVLLLATMAVVLAARNRRPS